MLSHPIMCAILPNLRYDQITELQMCSPELRRFIQSTRLNYPRAPIPILFITSAPEEGKLEVSLNRCPQIIPISWLGEISPVILFLENESLGLSLSERWLESVEQIGIEHVNNREAFFEFWSRTNCSRVGIHRIHFDIEASELLEKMPCVSRMMLQSAHYGPEFFEKLVEKSKLGPGIEYLLLEKIDKNRFDIEITIPEFIKNAKFCEIVAVVEVIWDYDESTFARLNSKILELGQCPGWNVVRNMDVTRLTYVIKTPSAEVTLVV